MRDSLEKQLQNSQNSIITREPAGSDDRIKVEQIDTELSK